MNHKLFILFFRWKNKKMLSIGLNETQNERKKFWKTRYCSITEIKCEIQVVQYSSFRDVIKPRCQKQVLFHLVYKTHVQAGATKLEQQLSEHFANLIHKQQSRRGSAALSVRNLCTPLAKLSLLPSPEIDVWTSLTVRLLTATSDCFA